MTEYRLLADVWMRTDPDTIDDRRPKVTRLGKGDLVPGITKDEVDYLIHGARPMLVEADSDSDPFKDDEDKDHVKSADTATEKGDVTKPVTKPVSK